MIRNFFAWATRLFICLAASCPTGAALAATVEWSALPNRERISISLAKDEGSIGDVSRNGATSLRLNLKDAKNAQGVLEDLALISPARAQYFSHSAPSGGALNIAVKNQAFGYIVNRNSPVSVDIDIFHDPTGAQWQDISQTTTNPPAQAPGAATPPAAENKTVSSQPERPVQPERTNPQTALPETPKPETPKPEKPKSEAPKAENAPDSMPAKESAGSGPGQTVSQTPLLSVSGSAPRQTPAAPPARGTGPGQAARETGGGPIVINNSPAPAQNGSGDRSNGGKNSNSQAATKPQPTPEPPVPPRTSAPETAVKPAQPPIPPEIPGPAAQLPVMTPPAPSADGPETSKKTSPAPGETAVPAAAPAAQAQPVQSSDVPPPAKPQIVKPLLETVRPDGSLVRFKATDRPLPDSPAVSPGGTLERGAKTPAAPAQPSGKTVEASPAPDGAQQNGTQNASSTLVQAGQKIPLKPGGQENVSGSAAQVPAGQLSQNAPASSGGHSSVQAAGTGGGHAASPMPEAKPDAKQEVIYIDAQGNPVPPPPDPAEVLKNVETQIGEGKFSDALTSLEELLRNPLLEDKKQREQALHRRADMIFALHKADPVENFAAIENSTMAAINYNLDSPRNAAAYLRLGYIYLAAGNRSMSDAYFNLLRKKFPDDAEVPLSYFYVADYLMRRGDYQAAADQFSHIVDAYPDSQYTRDAAIGLGRAYHALGYADQALSMVNFIEGRWPDYYLEYPPVLAMTGDVLSRAGEKERAALSYWTYYNLMPNAPDADIVLTRIGDIYYSMKQKEAAQEVYAEVLQRFPDTDAGLVAKMRLAEDGIYDSPRPAEIFPVFDRSIALRPTEVYEEIIKKHPNSQLVPIARLKLAMWHLWEKKYADALEQCSILAQTPNLDPVLAARAREVAMQAFSVMTSERVADQVYAPVRDLWERYPILSEQANELDPASRVGLATSMVMNKNPDGALLILEPLFLSKQPQYSEMALSLALSIFLEHEQWQKIEETAARIELWELTPELQTQLDYALALAYENMDKRAQASVIWKKLHSNSMLTKQQQAYIFYFLSRSSRDLQDFETAYNVGCDSLTLLLELAEEKPEKADNDKIQNLLNMLMDLANIAGKSLEALDYANMLQKYVQPGSEEYLSLQYNRAKIYRNRGDMENWRAIMAELSGKYPATMYGRMAASALREYDLRKNAAGFSSTGEI